MIEVGVNSGDALHPLLKQEQQHTRWLQLGFRVSMDWDSTTSPGHPILNCSELPVSSLQELGRNIGTKRVL